MKRREQPPSGDHDDAGELLTNFDAYCASVGAFVGRDYSGVDDPPAARAEQRRAWSSWVAARREHAKVHGWPGGLGALKNENFAAHPPGEPFDWTKL